MKDEPFTVVNAATKQEMDALFEELKAIEPQLPQTDQSQTVIEKRPGLKKFLSHCCLIRKYTFSVKTCFEPSCTICQPPRLPASIYERIHHLPDPIPDDSGEHYKSFEELYGMKTTERHCPSVASKATKGHGMPFSPTAQTATNVGETICCAECQKPRVSYSPHKIQYSRCELLKETLESVSYSCGTSLQELLLGTRPCDDEDSAAEANTDTQLVDQARQSAFPEVYVRDHLRCQDAIEIPYYSSQLFIDRCIHCASMEQLVNDQECYPSCRNCKESRVPGIFKRRKRCREGLLKNKKN